MKYSAALLSLCLIACSNDPAATAMDAGHDSSVVVDSGHTDLGTIDAGNTDAGSLDAAVTDAGNTDAGAPDSGAVDGSTGDASVVTDAGAIDASEDAGPTVVSEEVRAFATSRVDADAAYLSADCRCNYATYSFENADACVAALTMSPPDECYLMALTRHWDMLEARANCFLNLATSFADCMNSGECSTGHTDACNGAFSDGFGTCLDIAQEASTQADDEAAACSGAS